MNYVIKFVTYDYVYPLSPHVTTNNRRSTTIDRTTSNCNDAKEKVQKIRDLINMGEYDADLAKCIPGLMDLANQGMPDINIYKRKSSSCVLQRQGTTRFPNSFE